MLTSVLRVLFNYYLVKINILYFKDKFSICRIRNHCPKGTGQQDPLQEKLHFATFKMADCDCQKGRRCTIATLPQQSRMLGSQVSFATLHRTAAPTAAKDTATVAKGRK